MNPVLEQPVLKRDDDLGMAEAFGRDKVLEGIVRKLVNDYGIQTVIETGTWRGYTTRRFSEFVSHVISIDINRDFTTAAVETCFDQFGVGLLVGSSIDQLPFVIKSFRESRLYYLDAHWGNEWPLLGELDASATRDTYKTAICSKRIRRGVNIVRRNRFNT